MKKNMGNTDRLIRVSFALAFAILIIAKIISGVVGIILLVLAAVFVLTSLFGICPLYSIFGINTNKTQKPV